MFEIFGFLVMVIILIMISISAFIIGLNYLGQYGIGGIPNTWANKLFVLICWCIIIFAWYLTYINAPFSITFKHE